MVLMCHKKLITLFCGLFLITTFVSFSIQPFVLPVLAAESHYSLTDFSNFEKTFDHEFIYSTNNNTHVIFNYTGESSDYPILERFTYTLPVNCSDFQIQLKMIYYMSSVSEFIISYVKVFGEEYAIIEGGVWDAWAHNSGKYYMKSWANGTGETHEGSTNSAGLSGTVTLDFNRFGNTVYAKIKNEDSTYTHFSKEWSFGVSNLTSGFAVTFRTGELGCENYAIFYDLSANFTNSTPTILFPLGIFPITGIIFVASVIFIRTLAYHKGNRKSKE